MSGRSTPTANSPNPRRNGRRTRLTTAALLVLLLLISSSTASAQDCNATINTGLCQWCSSIFVVQLLACAFGCNMGLIDEWYANCLAGMTPPPPLPPTPISQMGLCVEGGWACQITFVDPVPDLQNGNRLTTNTQRLASSGTPVSAVAADSAARVVLRIGANTMGQALTLSVLDENMQPQAASLVGMLSSVGGTENTGTLSVVAQPTGQGPMAFAVYYPPPDFVRPGYQNDNTLGFRTIQFSVTSQTGNSYSSPLKLLRPPVVLVHGIWDSRDGWNSFPLFQDPAWNNGGFPRFSVERANYDIPLSTVTWASKTADTTDTTHTYSSSQLAKANANQLSFTYSAPFVFGDIGDAIAKFRNGANVVGQPAAAAQADVVGHSMGGLVARQISTLPQYTGGESFGVGNIHKLITIGTPHYGSPFATQALMDPLLEFGLAKLGNLVLGWKVVVSGQTVPGAVYDLRGNSSGNGGNVSPNLAALNNTAGNPNALPVAEIAGKMEPANWQGVSSGWRVFAWGLAWSLADCGPCAIELDINQGTYPLVFGNNDSDGIVAVTSQNATASNPYVVPFGVIHTSTLEQLGFAGPGEIEEQNYIPNQVIFLLNQPVGSSYFTKF